jgi:hypothetical protein
MRLPAPLAALVEDGYVEEVVRPLKSGKEASIYLVRAAGRPCAAKIYKDRDSRSFQNRAVYTEGRRVKSSRQQRAIDKKTRYGRRSLEEEWKGAEVDTLRRLHAAGVRVPEPLAFLDGVLVMGLVADAAGDPAPNLSMLSLTPAEARAVHEDLLGQVVRMLCAGVIHGDLSAQNVLLAAEGLTATSKGARVEFRGDQRTVIDGPFAESKEHVAGFSIIQAKSLEEAIELVKRTPNVFPNGEAVVEIRKLMDVEDFGEEFTPNAEIAKVKF